MQPPMIDRVCPICGSSDQSRIFAPINVDFQRLEGFAFASRKLPEYMHWRLVECPTCKLVYAAPLPSPDYLQRAYDAASFDSAKEAGLAAKTYARYLAKFVAQLPDRNGAVDVGTGEGAFLRELVNMNFSAVVGIEPSTAAIDAADPSIRSLIRHDIFRAGVFPAKSISLLTCFQTIEHVPDPLSLCKEAHAVLKPGGALFLVGHNRRAFSAKVLGMRSPIFDVEHMQLFSPQSAHALLQNAGFERILIKPIWNSYPLAYWLRLLPLPSGLKKFTINTVNAIGLGRLRIAIPAGNLAMVGFKPN